MQVFDPDLLDMEPHSEEWRKERKQLDARLTAATSFSRKYQGVYEQLQESFDFRRTIEGNVLRLDRIGPRFFDAGAAVKRSRAFVEGIEQEMRQIEAMSMAVVKSNDATPAPRLTARDVADAPAPYTGQYL